MNVRINHVHRMTNDIDMVSREQMSLVEVLVLQSGADRVDAAKLRLDQDGTTISVDVMADTADMPLPTDSSSRAFALARRMASATAESMVLQVVEGGETAARATVPIATAAALIALKTVAIPRRARSNSPAKVGSDIHDLVRLVQVCDFDAVCRAMSSGGDDLRQYVGATLVSWFSPDLDLRYTFARLRRLARSPDADALTEDDLALAADLGRLLR